MAHIEKTEVRVFGENREEVLQRYLRNLSKRTGEQWFVKKRYLTQTMYSAEEQGVQTIEYSRAVLVNGRSLTQRIFYVGCQQRWRRS